jgi:hypothetical protein
LTLAPLVADRQDELRLMQFGRTILGQPRRQTVDVAVSFRQDRNHYLSRKHPPRSSTVGLRGLDQRPQGRPELPELPDLISLDDLRAAIDFFGAACF